MRVGDLVKFSANAGFNHDIAGKRAVVVAIRPIPVLDPRDRWHEWDCLIDGKLETCFLYAPDDPDYLSDYGVEILSG